MRKIRDYVDIYRRLCARNRVRSRASPWRICRFPALLCAAFLLNASACASGTASQPPPATPNAGLFSWGAELVNQTDGELFSLLKQQGLTALYQNFSSKNSRQEQMSLFAESAMKAGITVYHLTGDPYWGLDPNGEQLCEAVEEAAAYNRRIKRKFLERREEDGQKWETVPQLAGIVLDVEPYTLKEWDRNRSKVMKDFVSGMKKAYQLARKYDLEVILCVPWYYDGKGQQKGLEELIKTCCDGIAVMNYYRDSEIKNIAAEVELVRKHNKEIITIYELKRANGKGIKEVNTYHNKGLDAVKRNYASLLDAYPGQTISIAYHDYQALKEVLKK